MNIETNELSQRELYAKVEKQAHSLRGNPFEYMAITGMCPVNVVELHAKKIQDLLTDRVGYKKEIAALRQRIAELESKAVKIVDCDFDAVQHMSGGSTDYCHGFVDGTQNAIRAITDAGIKVEAE